jgi:KipI family sensor histidine kinase inhibitor
MTRVGERAWLLELESSAQVHAARRLLDLALAPALDELVPGARTLLVVGRVEQTLDARRLETIEQTALRAADGSTAIPARTHEIAVRYDGADLAEVAAHACVGSDELIARHAAAAYRVAFVGFQPGFAYLDGLPQALHTPRRSTPRAHVPAGSVAIGGEWTGIYPLATPGGWNLLGTTSELLFDADRDAPALLLPGDGVRFVPR